MEEIKEKLIVLTLLKYTHTYLKSFKDTINRSLGKMKVIQKYIFNHMSKKSDNLGKEKSQ